RLAELLQDYEIHALDVGGLEPEELELNVVAVARHAHRRDEHPELLTERITAAGLDAAVLRVDRVLVVLQGDDAPLDRLGQRPRERAEAGARRGQLGDLLDVPRRSGLEDERDDRPV